jgi:hypothetical protein
MNIEERPLSKEQHLHNKKTWAMYMDKRVKNHAEYHLLHLLLIGRDILKGFKPLTTAKKIETYKTYQGRDKYYKTNAALHTVHSKLTWLQNINTKPEYKEKFYKDAPLNQYPLKYSILTGYNTVNGYTFPVYEQVTDQFLYIEPSMTEEFLAKIAECYNRMK